MLKENLFNGDRLIKKTYYDDAKKKMKLNIKNIRVLFIKRNEHLLDEIGHIEHTHKSEVLKIAKDIKSYLSKEVSIYLAKIC